MRKILTVAVREFRAMVGTKAFLISLGMMPLLMFGGILAIDLLRKSDQIEDRRIAIVDHSGEFYSQLARAADEHNAGWTQPSQTRNRTGTIRLNATTGICWNLSIRANSTTPSECNFPNAFAPSHCTPSWKFPAPYSTDSAGPFVAEDATLSSARRWIAGTLNELVSNRRLREAGIDPAIVNKAKRRVAINGMGLYRQNRDGEVTAEAEPDEMTAIFLPMMVMMLMFMVIFMASQPMLESVLEEKSSRVVEVLLGSVNPTQLMSGKLLGTVGGSLTIFAVYLAGGLAAAIWKDSLSAIPFHLVPWFILFQILGVLFFASIFMAVGSAVSQLKEAQSMLLPVWMLMMIPMFVWFEIVREPNGALANGLTWLPPAAPAVMVLRMATGATIPVWQIVGSLILLLAATAACVVIAGRIFRVGILWQGKTPKIGEMLRWGFTSL